MQPQSDSVIWLTCLVSVVKSELPDLSNRQMAVLLSVAFQREKSTVRGLAAHLGVTKPVISRALTKLSGLALLRREADPKDGRNVFAVMTDKGAQFVERLNQLLTQTKFPSKP